MDSYLKHLLEGEGEKGENKKTDRQKETPEQPRQPERINGGHKQNPDVGNMEESLRREQTKSSRQNTIGTGRTARGAGGQQRVLAGCVRGQKQADLDQ